LLDRAGHRTIYFEMYVIKNIDTRSTAKPSNNVKSPTKYYSNRFQRFRSFRIPSSCIAPVPDEFCSRKNLEKEKIQNIFIKTTQLQCTVTKLDQPQNLQ
jgi:hypothetical protein